MTRRHALIGLVLGYLLLITISGAACADAYTDWLDGKIGPVRTGPPLFTDAEWQALPDSYPFSYQFVDHHGIPTPTVAGRFINGVDYRYNPHVLAQWEYDSRILAAAGINMLRTSMRSIPEEGGVPPTLADWRRKNDISRQLGMAALLEPGGMYYLGILTDLYENVLRRPPPEAFSKWKDAFVTGKYGDFFNADYRAAHGQVLADLMRALGPGAVVGYVYSDEPSLAGVGPATAAADADWQAFLKRLYGDATPAADSNKDGVCFNAFFRKSYGSWDEVKQFTKEEYSRQIPVQALLGVWLRTGHARFIDEIHAQGEKVLPDALLSEAYVGREEVSLLNAMPHNRVIGFGNYGRIAQTAYYTAAAHAYNKPGFTYHINVPDGNYARARYMGVASLPFTAGQLWWHLTVGCNDGMPKDWGQSYCLANWWEINDPLPKNWGGKVNRLVEYDPRFLIIPQLAPFMGKFASMPAEMANGVLWVDPPVVDLVRNNHAVTEEALVFGEQKLDLDRYKLIIFMKRGPMRFAETYGLLRDYVARGGTVLANVNDVGSGETLIGQPNSQYWLTSYEPGRKRPRVGTLAGPVIHEDRFTDTSRWQKERFSHEGPCPLVTPNPPGHIGAFPDGASGSFTYKFGLPEEFTHFRITDLHYVWGRQNQVQMWISPDNQTWALQHDDPPTDVRPYSWSKVFSIKQDLGGSRTLYVKYFFKAGDPTRSPNDNRGACLKSFKLEGLTGEDVEALSEWQGQFGTTVTLGETSLKVNRLEPYVLPGAGMTVAGEVSDEKGARRPLLIVRPEGKGKWLAWNSPEAVPGTGHGGSGFNPPEWRAQWRLLDGLIRAHSAGRIEDYETPYVLQGDGCLMAAAWDGFTAPKNHEISFTSPHPRVVAWEVLDQTTEGGPYLQVKDGRATFRKDLSRPTLSAHLWVLKPYGQPIVLSADGTLKHMMRIEDGKLTGNRLEFTMAERAAVSCPAPPKSARHNGQAVQVQYDAPAQVARIVGSGRLGPCILEF